ADDGSTIRIASQVGALLAGGRVSRQPDPAGWVGFFLFGSVQEPFTQYQSIRALPAGCFLRVTSQGTGAITEYFSLAATFLHAANHPNPWQPEKVAENVRAILRDSVQAHLTADVPVGAFLSSGVDSGALVGLAQETKKEKIHTVTLSFEAFHQDQRDEAPLAQRVAEHYQTQHVTRMVTQPEFHREIPAILAAMDQPTIDGINTWFVSKAARELGLKVALSGLGGDELFGGYPSFSDIPRWLKIARLARHIPYSGPMFRHLSLPLFQSLPGLGAKGASFFMYGASFPGAYLLRRGVFMPWELPALLGEDMATEGLQRLDVLAHIEKSMPPAPSGTFARIASMEASLYMRNQLLRDTDWASMAHSLEVRTPLVDRVVLQSLAPLLIQSQTARGKQWLAQAPKPPLPPEVVYRKKTGFTIPVQAWLLNHPQLDGWRHVPMLAHHGCHGSRRLAYAVYHHRSQ
ncbi:MAG TPA: asparagine synthetase B, partial [Magnetococcales bacterium]|nr:asparagine synthetase B [Magnetococcales bacterium]